MRPRRLTFRDAKIMPLFLGVIAFCSVHFIMSFIVCAYWYSKVNLEWQYQSFGTPDNLRKASIARQECEKAHVRFFFEFPPYPHC